MYLFYFIIESLRQSLHFQWVYILLVYCFAAFTIYIFQCRYDYSMVYYRRIILWKYLIEFNQKDSLHVLNKLLKNKKIWIERFTSKINNICVRTFVM